MTAREELLRIQRRLVQRMKEEIRGSIQRESPEISRYIREYHRATRTSTAISDKKHLIDAVAASDLVYVGDYHTLRESQNTVLRLLDELIRRPDFWRRKKAVILALEMILAEHQPILDKYQQGGLDEPTFLRAIGYQENWGFNWSHYKVLLDYARLNGIDVIAVNSNPPRGPHHLRRRDANAAHILAFVSQRVPDALLMVLFGDLHVAERHLPAAVDAELARAGATRRRLIVYQNVERIYWSLARRGLEQKVDVVKIRDGAFAVLNSTPLASFRSYLDWQEQHEGLRCEMHPWWCDVGGPEVDLTDLVIDFVRTISAFLGIQLPIPKLEQLSVRTTHERDYLRHLGRQILTPEEVREIEVQIRKNAPTFVTRADTIFLPDFSVNHAAEQAAQFVLFRCSGTRRWVRRRHEDEFYAMVLRSALGYFGSKLVNHKRLCRKEPDYREFLARNRGRRLALDWQRELRRVAAYVCLHVERERAWLARGVWQKVRNINGLDLSVRLGFAHALGYMLGDRLFDALVQGHAQKEEIRRLFRRSFDRPGEPLSEYLYLVRRLQHVPELYASRMERI